MKEQPTNQPTAAVKAAEEILILSVAEGHILPQSEMSEIISRHFAPHIEALRVAREALTSGQVITFEGSLCQTLDLELQEQALAAIDKVLPK